jgi:hypothetical protein
MIRSQVLDEVDIDSSASVGTTTVSNQQIQLPEEEWFQKEIQLRIMFDSVVD